MWQDEAECRGLGITTFFPEDRHRPGSKPYWEEVEQLRSICSTCPARLACLRSNLEVQYGVFGGTAPEERRRITQVNCRCGRPLSVAAMLQSEHFCRTCKLTRDVLR